MKKKLIQVLGLLVGIWIPGIAWDFTPAAWRLSMVLTGAVIFVVFFCWMMDDK